MLDVMLWAALAAVVVIAVIVGRRAVVKKVPRKSLRPGTLVHYTDHAKQRMNERGVTAAEIESVLVDPVRTLSDPKNGSVRLEGDFDDSILKVWVVGPWPARGEIVIKTTAWEHIAVFDIPINAIGRVKGRGGATIRSIEERNGTRISIDRSGEVQIKASDRALAERAEKEVMSIVNLLDRKSA